MHFCLSAGSPGARFLLSSPLFSYLWNGNSSPSGGFVRMLSVHIWVIRTIPGTGICLWLLAFIVVYFLMFKEPEAAAMKLEDMGSNPGSLHKLGPLPQSLKLFSVKQGAYTSLMVIVNLSKCTICVKSLALSSHWGRNGWSPAHYSKLLKGIKLTGSKQTSLFSKLEIYLAIRTHCEPLKE